jgi:hypothetical protein
LKAEEIRINKQLQLDALSNLIQSGGSVDINTDIDAMPDCREKYKIIVQRSK